MGRKRDLEDLRRELERSRHEDLGNNGTDREGYQSYYPESERTKKLKQELRDETGREY
jgi:hypothetical protein